MRWLNRSITILNSLSQLLDIYRYKWKLCEWRAEQQPHTLSQLALSINL